MTVYKNILDEESFKIKGNEEIYVVSSMNIIMKPIKSDNISFYIKRKTIEEQKAIIEVKFANHGYVYVSAKCKIESIEDYFFIIEIPEDIIIPKLTVVSSNKVYNNGSLNIKSLRVIQYAEI